MIVTYQLTAPEGTVQDFLDPQQALVEAGKLLSLGASWVKVDREEIEDDSPIGRMLGTMQ